MDFIVLIVLVFLLLVYAKRISEYLDEIGDE